MDSTEGATGRSQHRRHQEHRDGRDEEERQGDQAAIAEHIAKLHSGNGENRDGPERLDEVACRVAVAVCEKGRRGGHTEITGGWQEIRRLDQPL